MPRILIDTSVLFAAAYRRDSAHEDALPILRGVDTGSLPEAVVLDYILAETLNGLTTHAGHDAAVDFLDRIEENGQFHVESVGSGALSAGKTAFRRYEPLSFVDGCLVGYLWTEDLEYLYAFDDDFDLVEEISRLDTPANPYNPE